MSEKLIRVCNRLKVIAGILLFVGLLVETQEIIPDNAKILINTRTHEYFSPDCSGFINPLELALFQASTYREAKNLGYQANKKCRDSGGLKGASHTLLYSFLLSPESRWTDEGPWRY